MALAQVDESRATRKRTFPTTEHGRRVIAYGRVSTADQVESGAGLAAQRTAVGAACTGRGWRLVQTYEDAGISGKTMANRPGLLAALEAIESGRASGLVVAKLDRLSRSLLDFAALMERSRRRGWALIALDLGVDTTTPSGELMATILASFAMYERRLIGVRTKEALAEKRAAGVRLGRPRVLAAATVALIAQMRREGRTLDAIADELNARCVPTAHRGSWHATTVRRIALQEVISA
jgi:DNA invertase Pin-like site-specific DNA recombinase